MNVIEKSSRGKAPTWEQVSSASNQHQTKNIRKHMRKQWPTESVLAACKDMMLQGPAPNTWNRRNNIAIHVANIETVEHSTHTLQKGVMLSPPSTWHFSSLATAPRSQKGNKAKRAKRQEHKRQAAKEKTRINHRIRPGHSNQKNPENRNREEKNDFDARTNKTETGGNKNFTSDPLELF